MAFADWFVSPETKALIAKADQGDLDAQFQVAVAYDLGKGAPKDIDTASRYYRMAADQGFAEAQNSLGSLLQSEKRYADALIWFDKAAALNHPQATNNEAYLYDLGLGVKQDRNKAFELYSRAADLGWAEAMWNIANIYGFGQLGKRDLVMACVWAWRASRFASAAQQNLKAHLSDVLGKFEHNMPADQFAVCSKQGQEWTPALVPAQKSHEVDTP